AATNALHYQNYSIFGRLPNAGHRIMEQPLQGRRVLSSRNTTLAKRSAAWLAKRNVSPNFISVLGIVFAFLALFFFYRDALNDKAEWSSMLAAAVFIRLRLLMNLLDGMVAVEFNKKAALGVLYNEI